MFGRMPIRRGPSDDDSGYRLPPALARLPTDHGRLRQEFVERNQRDRILTAALAVFGTKGFLAATVSELADEASVSRSTFYKFFDDKEACLLALVEEVVGWLEAEARDAAGGAADWPAAVVAVTGRLVGLLLADPELARVCEIASFAGGPDVRARWEAAIDRLVRGLRRGRDELPPGMRLPPSLELLLVQGGLSVTVRSGAAGPDPKAKKLAAELAEIALIPYLGAAGAARAVRSSRPRR